MTNWGETFLRDWERYRVQLEYLAYKSCRDRTEAEDVVAAAFERTWRVFCTGGIDALRPYLWQAVLNELHGRSRRRQAEQRASERMGPIDTIEPGADVNSNRSDIWDAVELLSPTQTQVLILRFQQGLTVAEIATVLEVQVDTVKARVTRALKALRRHVEKAYLHG